MDRCEECKLYDAETSSECPGCGGVFELRITDLTLIWECKTCGYGLATTANKLCVWDNKKYGEEAYGKYDICPYATKEGD